MAPVPKVALVAPGCSNAFGPQTVSDESIRGLSTTDPDRRPGHGRLHPAAVDRSPQWPRASDPLAASRALDSPNQEASQRRVAVATSDQPSSPMSVGVRSGNGGSGPRLPPPGQPRRKRKCAAAPASRSASFITRMPRLHPPALALALGPAHRFRVGAPPVLCPERGRSEHLIPFVTA